MPDETIDMRLAIEEAGYSRTTALTPKLASLWLRTGVFLPKLTAAKWGMVSMRSSLL